MVQQLQQGMESFGRIDATTLIGDVSQMTNLVIGIATTEQWNSSWSEVNDF